MWEEILARETTGELLAAWIAKEELRYLLALARTSPARSEVSNRLFAFYDWCAGGRRRHVDSPHIFGGVETTSPNETGISARGASGGSHRKTSLSPGMPRWMSDLRLSPDFMAEIAQFAGRPYGTVLIHRPAGVFPAADLAPGLRGAGEQAARKAIAAGSCVADLSSLHLLGLLDRDDRIRVRAKLPSLIVARAAVDDALLARDNLRGVAAATYIASLAPDGTIERTTLTAVQQALLRGESEALERLASTADVRYPATAGDAVASARNLAAERGLALWCDDTCGLQKARGAGIAAFCLFDLLTTLHGDGVPLDLASMYQRLAGHYVMDLLLTAEGITALAATNDWLVGPAHTTLARPGWWRHHGVGWEDHWLQIATQARAHSPEALTIITKAALTGALQSVTFGLSTQRYQRIAVLALAGCHEAGLPARGVPPGDLLLRLADRNVWPGVLFEELQQFTRRVQGGVREFPQPADPGVRVPGPGTVYGFEHLVFGFRQHRSSAQIIGPRRPYAEMGELHDDADRHLVIRRLIEQPAPGGDHLRA
jgi:hypothetical protein